MWILDSEGDFLEGIYTFFPSLVLLFIYFCLGKRVWLRPGKKYLFGRIKQDGGMATLLKVEHTVQQHVLTKHFPSSARHPAFFDIPKTHGD